jgi:site-specific DNA-methyltransferase (adenine-specific)
MIETLVKPYSQEIHDNGTQSTIYQLDCIEGMKQYPDKHFDLAVVDPPYGLGEKLTDGGTWSRKWQVKGADWDKVPTKEY